MLNYLINDDTIAILKKENKTIIYNVDKTLVFNINIKKIIDFNCLFYGSDLKGRQRYAQNSLKVKYKVPIIISEAKNIILIQTNNIRDDTCYFFVGNKIIDYEEIDNRLIVTCKYNKKFLINISKYSFEKLLLNYLRINNLLKC